MSNNIINNSSLNQALKNKKIQSLDKLKTLKKGPVDGQIQSKIKNDHQSTLSKAGLTNIFSGTREVLKNSFKSPKNPLLEGEMVTHTIPIKTILLESADPITILEELTDHIRSNANKYAGAALAGAGATAAHLATGGDFGGLGFDHDNDHSTSTSDSSNSSNSPVQKHQTQQDYFNNELKNAGTVNHSTDVKNDNGVIGNMLNGLKMGATNLQAENKYNALKDATDNYNNIKDSAGETLTLGQKVGTGATILGSAAGASILNSRRKKR